ncbi:MAG: branched-chain amino acid ABC transporter permease [Actinobacteria bacterium]|nr:branched-chain amino acid ABC transporter permease [Actinomycetota bacterium]
MDKFLISSFNGITLAALYFIVASGFSLIFGVMRIVNLAHGSLYLAGAYLGWEVGDATGNWWLGLLVGALAMMLLGIILQVGIFSWMQGEDLRQAMITIGISIVIADQMLARYGGFAYQFPYPDFLRGATLIPLLGIRYPTYRLFLVVIAIVLGVLLWLLLSKTKLGMTIRAGIDDRDMLSALGVNVARVFVVVFALGAFLAGFAGVIGGTAFSIIPGEDARFLVASLVVVIVGGMGSLGGAAIGALLVGMASQYSLAYVSTYAPLVTFALMTVVLALRPRGLFGREAREGT